MNIKKRITALLLVVCVVLMTTSCNRDLRDESDNNKELCAVLGSEPDTLDPAITLTIDVRSYLSHLFEGLTVLGSDGTVEPGCASKWIVNDESTQFTFIIDKTAIWNDGKKVTANDFRYEWLRVLSPETGSGWASFLYYIKGAEKYNRGECKADEVGINVNESGDLIVDLEAPCTFFTAMTAMQPYYPVREDVVAKNSNWASSENDFVSNGAYNLNAWNHDASIILEKNDSFHKKINSEYNTLKFLLMEDSGAIMNAYETGETDFVEKVLTVDEMEQVGTVEFCDYTVTKFLSINSKRDVFSDIRVRKAICLALNRESISTIMGSGYKPLCSWLPEGFINSDTGKDFRDEAENRVYFAAEGDLTEARKLMSEAGYPDGKGFKKIDYLTNTSSLNIRLAEIVKEQLAQIGIQVNIITYEQKVFSEYRRNREFDIVAASWAAEYPDISSYFYGFQSNDINNYASFSNIQYDELYRKALLLTNNTDRFEFYHQQEDLLMDSWYILPLYSENTSYIASSNLTDYSFDITGCLNFSNAKYNSKI